MPAAPRESLLSLVRFDLFVLDLRSGELRKSGVPLKLPPQPFKLLALLASRAGQVVTREEIRRLLWGEDTFVDFEQGVNHCIRDIRMALGDDADRPRYVETLPRRGYRFIAAVEPVAPKVPMEAARGRGHGPRALAAGAALLLLGGGYFAWWSLRPSAVEPGRRLMLAVLPFENLSGDPDDEYLSDGLTEDMITQLGRLDPERLGVIARTSSMRYKGAGKSVEEIGRELRVDYLLEGSVRRSGERLRISAQLIQVRDETHLWADHYDRELRDVLAVQGEVAQAVAREIQLTLSAGLQASLRRSLAVDPVVFEYYLRGRYFETRGLEKAQGFFQQVVERDPSYAPAHAALARVYVLMGNWGTLPTKEALARAQAAARRAIELDDDLPDGHLAIADSTRDAALAEREYRRALELDPGHSHAHQSYGLFLAGRGRFEEGLSHLKRAHELDPLSGIINANVALGYFYLKRYDEAIAQSLRTLEIDPDRITARIDLGRAYAQKGMYAESIAEYEKVLASGIEPRVAEAMTHLTYTYARAGKQEEAKRSLVDLHEFAKNAAVPAAYFVVCYASLGDMDRAFSWLDKAVEEGYYDVYGLKTDPEFESLRSDPRLPGVLRRLGLAP